MQKIRAAVKTPLALLVLIGVVAHLAPIVLMASSIGIGVIQTFRPRRFPRATWGASVHLQLQWVARRPNRRARP